MSRATGKEKRGKGNETKECRMPSTGDLGGISPGRRMLNERQLDLLRFCSRHAGTARSRRKRTWFARAKGGRTTGLLKHLRPLGRLYPSHSSHTPSDASGEAPRLYRRGKIPHPSRFWRSRSKRPFCNAVRRSAETGAKGTGECPAPAQAPQASVATGCDEGVGVVTFLQKASNR